MSPAPLALALAVLAVPSAVRAGEKTKMQPGQWEISAQVEAPGVGTLPPTTQSECLSQQDVDADPVPSVDRGACRATDVQRQGDKVTWNLACTGAMPGQGKGEIVYRSATAYDGWMTFETGGTTVKTTVRARRVGDCSAP